MSSEPWDSAARRSLVERTIVEHGYEGLEATTWQKNERDVSHADEVRGTHTKSGKADSDTEDLQQNGLAASLFDEVEKRVSCYGIN